MKILAFLILLISMPYKSFAQDCSVEKIAQNKLAALEKYKIGDFNSSANFLENIYYSCYEKISGGIYSDSKKADSFYWFLSYFILAEYKAGKTNDCISVGISSTADRNIPMEGVKDSPAFKAVLSNLSLCKKKRELEIGDFKKIDCPAKIELSDKNGLYCISVTTGNNSQNVVDEESGKYSREDYPYVNLIVKDDDTIQAQKLFFTSGTFSKKSYCFSPSSLDEAEFFSVMLKDGNYFIRIRSAFRYCWPGSAFFIADSVYKIDVKTGVIPVDELNIAVH